MGRESNLLPAFPEFLNSVLAWVCVCLICFFFNPILELKVMARNGYQKINNDTDVQKVSFVSVLLFQWMNSVFKTGNERTIDQSDFLPLSDKNTTCFQTENLKAKWNEEIADCKGKGKKPRLWKSVMKMLPAKDVLFLTLTGTVNSVCRLIEPLLLGYFVASLLSSESQHTYRLYGCVSAMFITSLARNLCAHQFAYRGDVWGIRISSALRGLIYTKVSYQKLIYKWQHYFKKVYLINAQVS